MVFRLNPTNFHKEQGRDNQCAKLFLRYLRQNLSVLTRVGIFTHTE
jgi:hypothetical protein